MTAAMVMLGGAGGAMLRYLIDLRMQRGRVSAFPWGTLVVNVLGSALLGLLTAWVLATGTAGGSVFALAGVGLCGSLTTFSTFGYDTVQLISQRRHRHAAANVAVTVLSGFAAALAGLLAGSALWS
ncbi:fluoride efflux transporter CrcB [Prauserella halophila]|uniref:Fluoride-specific ion channel FluC n=1 Tax=Prauserella halophila TaxID=185641 RepID=A0ABP4GHX2_9PSEU|nr:fluoride efflux transporter CrcB [Prauserella halophila]MCP2234245.1 CrcB protein [Prauserella halophila]